MKFSEFERVMSPARMARYLQAAGGNKRRARTLYKLNLRLSQALFPVVSCFEVTLRNLIDMHYVRCHGEHWLRDAAQHGGMFGRAQCGITPQIIKRGLSKFSNAEPYAHPKLVAMMDFGFWRYMFGPHQYYYGGQTLLQIFPVRPRSSAAVQYDHNFVFAELEKINGMRNRLAHHEPLCFRMRQPLACTLYVRQRYHSICQLFQWMQVNNRHLLYGVDQTHRVCEEIDLFGQHISHTPKV